MYECQRASDIRKWTTFYSYLGSVKLYRDSCDTALIIESHVTLSISFCSDLTLTFNLLTVLLTVTVILQPNAKT